MSKIAFLFLTIDNVNHPDLWKDYLSEDSQKVSIYIHPKYPKKISVDWMKENIISNLVSTNWGYLTDAFYQLLKTAYRDNQNQHFIFVSDSCVPVCRFLKLYQFINSFPKKTSFIHFKAEIDDYDWNKKIKKTPGYHKYSLKKHEGLGNCLSRYHALKLLKSEYDFKNFFNNLNCGDEFFLSLLKASKYIYDHQMTFYNWDENKNKIKIINQQMDNIYRHVENLEIERINKKIKSLRNKNKSNKMSLYQKTLKKISLGNNERLLSKRDKKELQKLKIEKSTLGKHPKLYTHISSKEINKLINKGYFFLRKVNTGVEIKI